MQNAYTIACALKKMDSVQHFEKKSECPSNKNFLKQHRLVSTKKKETKRSKLRLKKPNSDEFGRDFYIKSAILIVKFRFFSVYSEFVSDQSGQV